MSVLSKQAQFYPPLLQPESIDYSMIDCNLALELRLPPKVPYKFVFVRYGLSGAGAMYSFLNRSEVAVMKYDSVLNVSGIRDICVSPIFFNQQEECHVRRVFYVLKSCDNIVILVRDPLSRITSMINHGDSKNNNIVKEISILDDPHDAVNSVGFFLEDGKIVANYPVLSNAFVAHVIQSSAFGYYSNISALPANANITYLDMQEIMPTRAFDTMTKLAKKFGFSLPKELDRDYYKEIKFGMFKYILPIIYKIFLQTGVTVRLYIAMRYHRDETLSIINDTVFDTPHPLLDQVAFSMSEDDLKALQDDKETLDKVKAYMLKFLDELKKRTDYIQRNKKHENDVLEIFRGDRDLRRKFKAMLDRELIHIKAHRPDIVASWKYYQEFERMCVEEGDM